MTNICPTVQLWKIQQCLNQNLILNCSSLRHLAANKCMTASLVMKRGKSGRIIDRQILNLEKNTHHY
jgi:hypothetical protein